MTKLLALTAVSAAIYLFCRWDNDPTSPAAQPPIASQIHSSDMPASKATTVVSSPSAPDCLDFTTADIVEPRQSLYQAAETELQHALDAGGYGRLVKNSSSAGQLAAFALAMKCSPAGGNADLSFISMQTLLGITPATCAGVEPADRGAPLALLSPNLIQDSPEVQLIAAKGALLWARYLEYTDGQREEIHSFLKLAQELGHGAATAGLKPALTFMAEQYDTGSFGEVQLIKAYAYMKQLSVASTDQTGTMGANYIYQKMTRTEFDTAERQFKACQQPRASRSPLTSPF